METAYDDETTEAHRPHPADPGATWEGEAVADAKGRLALGSAGASPGRHYIVRRQADDTLTLLPARMIPEREMPVWENPELAAKIRQGIAESERGEVADLGSFAAYAEVPDEADA